MNKVATVVFVGLLWAISTAGQPSQQHFNLGMTIDEFVSRFDAPAVNAAEIFDAAPAVHKAEDGKRAKIQATVDGKRMTFLFERRLLREIDVTAGNTFEHELHALTEELGASEVSRVNLAVWDRDDGTRFTLTSHQGTGVLVIAPTPGNSNRE